MQRPIDKAMGEQRPEKKAIRELWLEKVAEFEQEFRDDDVPLYLTLPGSDGYDLKLFTDRGYIRITENGALDEESQNRIVAVERNAMAVLELQRKYPGLKILEQDLESLLRGPSLIRYPDNKHVKYFRARIVNLDFDMSLQARQLGSNFDVPILIWIEKICRLHAEEPRLDWCLFLTLNASISWPEPAREHAIKIMQDNFQQSTGFSAQCRVLMGDELYRHIVSETAFDLSSDILGHDGRQKFLMTFVPKMITQKVFRLGWRVKTVKNLRYGGHGGRAPMVTWIFTFNSDNSAISSPNKVYKESLQDILTSAGHITKEGEVETIDVNTPEQISQSHVFISYVRENSDQVRKLAKELEKHGITVWLDREGIGPGQDWRDSIKSAIADGSFFIACFSKEYEQKKESFMNEELNLAIDQLRLHPPGRVWFIPVKLSQVEIPDFRISAAKSLRDFQWVELYKDWDEGIRRILSVIQPSGQT